jgi:uncharacterized protein (DUF4415 family)
MKRKPSRPRTSSRVKGANRRPASRTRAEVRSDAEIDTSDIAPLTDDFFLNAVRNPFYRPIKQSTTVRIDADVLAWLKSFGPGYQTRINALLRAAMERATRRRP